MAEEDTCSLCKILASKSAFRIQKNIEGRNVDLCGECAVEYQAGWRPEHSPDRPYIEQFLYEVKSGKYTPRNEAISKRLAEIKKE
jgi:hypothetical protein